MEYSYSYISAAGWRLRYTHDDLVQGTQVLHDDIVDPRIYTFSSMRVVT